MHARQCLEGRALLYSSADDTRERARRRVDGGEVADVRGRADAARAPQVRVPTVQTNAARRRFESAGRRNRRLRSSDFDSDAKA
jgi:hypothetical protein